MAELWQILGLGIALALVLLPEPVTSATGTLVGLAIIGSMFGAGTGVIPA